MTLPEVLEDQARSCDALGSPFTARLLRLLARRLRPGTPLADRLHNWPGDITSRGQSVPLRLAGALNALVLSGCDPTLAGAWPPHAAPDDQLWRVVESALANHADTIGRFLDSPPQTNEVGRSAVLIAAGHWLTDRFGLPIRLSELGASAGLNLNWDRYRLHLGARSYGPADAVLTLAPENRGALPPEARPVIAGRRGVDLAPPGLADPGQRRRLLAYVWPDQRARVERLAAALSLPQAPVDRGDAADWLAARLAAPAPSGLHLVYHTIAWQYFPEPTQAACHAALAQAGARAMPEAPLAHLGMEADGAGPGAGLTLTLWPGGETLTLGRADFHGRWLDWHPEPGA